MKARATAALTNMRKVYFSELKDDAVQHAYIPTIDLQSKNAYTIMPITKYTDEMHVEQYRIGTAVNTDVSAIAIGAGNKNSPHWLSLTLNGAKNAHIACYRMFDGQKSTFIKTDLYLCEEIHAVCVNDKITFPKVRQALF